MYHRNRGMSGVFSMPSPIPDIEHASFLLHFGGSKSGVSSRMPCESFKSATNSYVAPIGSHVSSSLETFSFVASAPKQPQHNMSITPGEFYDARYGGSSGLPALIGIGGSSTLLLRPPQQMTISIGRVCRTSTSFYVPSSWKLDEKVRHQTNLWRPERRLGLASLSPPRTKSHNARRVASKTEYTQRSIDEPRSRFAWINHLSSQVHERQPKYATAESREVYDLLTG